MSLFALGYCPLLDFGCERRSSHEILRLHSRITGIAFGATTAAHSVSQVVLRGGTYVRGGRPALPAPPVVVEVPDVPALTGLLKGSEPPLFKYILWFEGPLLPKL
jgi:hypothetical protein